MSFLAFLITFGGALSAAVATYAQGTSAFQNLDFESANLSGFPIGSRVPIGAALPGWSGWTGTSPLSEVLYDGININGGAISIMDSLTPVFYPPLQGNYSALLMGTSPQFGESTTISQTGFVPTGTRSLVVDMLWQIASPPAIMVDGQSVAMIPIKNFASYTLYAGDISSFAGETATLSFTAPVTGFLELDSIIFSTAAVPEPGMPTLFFIGALLTGGLLRLRKK